MSLDDSSKRKLGESGRERETIPMPAPTAFPMVAATGVALMATGIATSVFISVTGLVILLFAVHGWIAELAPGQGEIEESLVPVDQRAGAVVQSKRTIAQPRPGLPAHRAHFPERVHPYSAGVVGGLLGGGVMALVAILYGVISGSGVWYPINMLSGIVLNRFSDSSTAADLAKFDVTALTVASVLHLVFSSLAGLFFGIILPTLPSVARVSSPVFWGGLVAPLMWTGAVYGLMGVLNPVMDHFVDWPWFVASQFVYGLTLGIYVSQKEKVSAKRIEGEVFDEGAR